jgi:fido (protein-threonine AMPylation protein)
LAPLLAEQVLRVERLIASGAFATQPLASGHLLQFHQEIAGDLVPEWAGRWRDAEVRVGEHHPPPPYRVPLLMRDYGEDLKVRLENVSQKANFFPSTRSLISMGA